MLSSFWRCKDKQKVQFLQKDWGVFFVFVYHCSMLLCLSIHLVAVKKSPLFVGSGQKGNPVNRYWKLPSGSVPESGWCHSPYKVSFLRICRKVVSRCSDALSGCFTLSTGKGWKGCLFGGFFIWRIWKPPNFSEKTIGIGKTEFPLEIYISGIRRFFLFVRSLFHHIQAGLQKYSLVPERWLFK